MKIRINKTAQAIMDKLYDDGFVSQMISNSVWHKGKRQQESWFFAEEVEQRRRSRRYEGFGNTLLQAIRAAVKDGPE